MNQISKNNVSSLKGKNHSKKLRNFYAGSKQPPAIRIPEALEGVGQTGFVLGSGDADAGKQVRLNFSIIKELLLYLSLSATFVYVFDIKLYNSFS